jgi:hypothetical protein
MDDEHDYTDASLALMKWFQSQDIDKTESCAVMLNLTGLGLSQLADSKSEMEDKLAIAVESLQEKTRGWWDAARKTRRRQ